MSNLTREVEEIVVGYLRLLGYFSLRSLPYKKDVGISDIDVVGMKQDTKISKMVLAAVSATQPYFSEANTKIEPGHKLNESKLRLGEVLEAWSKRTSWDKGWVEDFKSEVKKCLPSNLRKGLLNDIADVITTCLEDFHHPQYINNQSKALKRYCRAYEYPQSSTLRVERWFIDSDLYSDDLKELMKVDFQSKYGKTRLIDEAYSVKDVIREVKKEITKRVKKLNKMVEPKKKNLRAGRRFTNIAIEVLKWDCVYELLK